MAISERSEDAEEGEEGGELPWDGKEDIVIATNIKYEWRWLALSGQPRGNKTHIIIILPISTLR